MFEKVKVWFFAGVDDAILNFAKGLFHAALVGAALYAYAQIQSWHPDTETGVIAYAIVYRVWKAFLVYAGISGEFESKESVPTTGVIA